MTTSLIPTRNLPTCRPILEYLTDRKGVMHVYTGLCSTKIRLLGRGHGPMPPLPKDDLDLCTISYHVHTDVLSCYAHLRILCIIPVRNFLNSKCRYGFRPAIGTQVWHTGSYSPTSSPGHG